MFVRCVTAHPKPNMAAEASKVLETKILPILNKCKGFRDAMILTSPDQKETLGISIWDSKEYAEAYERSSSAEVMRMMAPFSEGAPQVKTYDLTFSTGKMTAARAGRA
jgi:hypothetical protein